MNGPLQSLAPINVPPSNKAPLTSLLKPCPPSNKEFSCDGFHTIEGQYQLVHDIHFDTIAPQFNSGTHAVFISSRLKPSSSATSLTDSTSSPSSSSKPPYDDKDVSRSTAVPIPIQTSHHYHDLDRYSDSSSPSYSNPLLTPPRNTPTLLSNPPSTFHQHLHPSSPTPTSSTPLSTTHDPLPSVSVTTPIPTLSVSTSITTNHSTGLPTESPANQHDFSASFSSLFTRRNSVRYPHTQQRKPRNNLTKTKSSFVQKMVVHDRLASILANRSLEDGFLFFNVGTSFLWMDAQSKPKDPLSRIVFSKAYPTCHDVNLVTKTNEHLDVIIGFSSGDLVWYDPLTSKYFRLNKDGNMKKEAVTKIKWIPGSEDLFMAAFADGTIMIMDKDRDDQPFTTLAGLTWIEQQFHVTRPHKSNKYNPLSHWSVNDKGVTDFAFSPDSVYLAVVGSDGTLRIINYIQERLLDVFASYYGNFLCVAWSPDGRYILTGGQDDLVTIWGMAEKRIVARCQGHKSWVTGVAFDAFRCDEGNLYRFGSVGEDCKLMLWDFSYSALHRPKNKRRHHPGSPKSPKDAHRFSFVSTDAIKYRGNYASQLFDPLPALESLDQAKLSPAVDDSADSASPTLLSPSPPSSPTPPTQPTPPRHSFGFRKRSQGNHFFRDLKQPQPTRPETHHVAMPTLHPAQSKKQVPLLQPCTVRAVHGDPCLDIIFNRQAIITTDRRGRIRTWGRP
ncbi:WD40 repeat-like protein [Hesseltinella vesiculosa]|uniref:WD40 repeat-like protein n=1 Tax=Hesseltinella vesiculosa TaxID=101127 RepID=A0A1X2GTL7_9FUNG|nr:WD40 repeat-like protein [Hesseltinella vesiculosa]